MKEFKASKAPWSFHEEDGEGNHIVVSDDGDVVCVVGSYMTSVEDDFANGPLIAAAPELLSVLQKIVESGCVLPHLKIESQWVIAKALGESQ